MLERLKKGRASGTKAAAVRITVKVCVSNKYYATRILVILLNVKVHVRHRSFISGVVRHESALQLLSALS